jgi:hypothetical protein
MHVEILHDPYPSFRAYEPGRVLVKVFAVKVDADTHERAAEVAYALCNSYPEEMFCAAEHAGQVAAYRANRLRSLSVGDVVVVDGHAFAYVPLGCKPVGPPEWVAPEQLRTIERMWDHPPVSGSRIAEATGLDAGVCGRVVAAYQAWGARS